MFIDEPTGDSPVTESEEHIDAPVEVTEDETPEPTEEKKSVDWESEAKKWQAIAKRHEKKQNAPEPIKDISPTDVLYLSKASDIEPEDVSELVEYAKLKGIGLKEAHAFYKPILKERAEERRTAQATQTRSPRGTSKVDGETLLRKAEQSNQLPESDEAITELFLARRARNFPKR